MISIFKEHGHNRFIIFACMWQQIVRKSFERVQFEIVKVRTNRVTLRPIATEEL